MCYAKKNASQATDKLASKGTARRDARFGIRRERKDSEGQQSLQFAATLTLASMILARSSTNLQRKIDLTKAFKNLFATILLSHAAKLLLPWKTGLGVLGGRVRTRMRVNTREKLRATKLGICRGP